MGSACVRVCAYVVCVTQEWMHKTVLEVVGSGGVDLQGLLEGRASCFTSVHSAAIVGHVASPNDYPFPETLGMDKYRLGLFGTEFSYLSVLLAMLINVAKVLSCFPSRLKVMTPACVCREGLLCPSPTSWPVLQVMNTFSEMFTLGVAQDMKV